MITTLLGVCRVIPERYCTLRGNASKLDVCSVRNEILGLKLPIFIAVILFPLFHVVGIHALCCRSSSDSKKKGGTPGGGANRPLPIPGQQVRFFLVSSV